MSYRRRNGADFAATVTGDCLVRCEVLGDQIEFWFGDVGSGLHLYFDPPAYHKFAQVESDMVALADMRAGSRARVPHPATLRN